MSSDLETYAIIKDGKVFQKAFLNFPEREVGELNEEEKTIDFYQNNFNKFQIKVDELIAKIDSEENKGSFLSYLENLKNAIPTTEGVGDFESLFTRINGHEVEITNQIRINRERNLSVKRGFIEELKELVKGDDTFLFVERILDIKGKWIRVGAVDKEFTEELDSTFKDLTDGFFEKHNAAISKELILYKEIINESKKLANVQNLKDSRKRIIEIQQEWKMLPKIPKNEYVPLFKKLREIHDEYFTKLGDVHSGEKKEKRKSENEEGLKAKQALIEKAKEFVKEVNKFQIKDLKEIQLLWKTSGRIGKADSDRLWHEFSAVCEEFFERKTLDIQSQKRMKSKNESEVLKFKIQLLKDSIRSEKKNLQTVEDNLGAFRLNISSKKMENLFTNQDVGANRKLEVKEKILMELKAELNGLEKPKK